ncbi:unnamed protein product [Pedinophyceae sp. YPF-701]|nr:unnamed protein product [Pedinophyceae sp. YPF-701]
MPEIPEGDEPEEAPRPQMFRGGNSRRRLGHYVPRPLERGESVESRRRSPDSARSGLRRSPSNAHEDSTPGSGDHRWLRDPTGSMGRRGAHSGRPWSTMESPTAELDEQDSPLGMRMSAPGSTEDGERLRGLARSQFGRDGAPVVVVGDDEEGSDDEGGRRSAGRWFDEPMVARKGGRRSPVDAVGGRASPHLPVRQSVRSPESPGGREEGPAPPAQEDLTPNQRLLQMRHAKRQAEMREQWRKPSVQGNFRNVPGMRSSVSGAEYRHDLQGTRLQPQFTKTRRTLEDGVLASLDQQQTSQIYGPVVIRTQLQSLVKRFNSRKGEYDRVALVLPLSSARQPDAPPREHNLEDIKERLIRQKVHQLEMLRREQMAGGGAGAGARGKQRRGARGRMGVGFADGGYDADELLFGDLIGCQEVAEEHDEDWVDPESLAGMAYRSHGRSARFSQKAPSLIDSDEGGSDGSGRERAASAAGSTRSAWSMKSARSGKSVRSAKSSRSVKASGGEEARSGGESPSPPPPPKEHVRLEQFVTPGGRLQRRAVRDARSLAGTPQPPGGGVWNTAPGRLFSAPVARNGMSPTPDMPVRALTFTPATGGPPTAPPRPATAQPTAARPLTARPSGAGVRPATAGDAPRPVSAHLARAQQPPYKLPDTPDTHSLLQELADEARAGTSPPRSPRRAPTRPGTAPAQIYRTAAPARRNADGWRRHHYMQHGPMVASTRVADAGPPPVLKWIPPQGTKERALYMSKSIKPKRPQRKAGQMEWRDVPDPVQSDRPLWRDAAPLVPSQGPRTERRSPAKRASPETARRGTASPRRTKRSAGAELARKPRAVMTTMARDLTRF